jgi:hypothetical protein
MNTYSALRPFPIHGFSNGGDYVTEAVAVSPQLSAGALTPAA